MILASSVRRFFRSTMRSIMPCSRRNSLLWKFFGSSRRTVFQMVRLPAKPTSAPGSARMMSPSPAQEREIGHADHDGSAADEAPANDGGVAHAGLGLLRHEPLRIGDAVLESQRITGGQIGEPFLETVAVEQLGDPLRGGQVEVIV